MICSTSTSGRALPELMPTLANIGPYRFFFYSNEGQEPPHIHVERDQSIAKFWLEPVALAWSQRFPARELREIERIVIEEQQSWRNRWHEYFNR
jgi:hypothetical protein